jgi:O-methyltransferase
MPRSPLLGARATAVYRRFVESLDVDGDAAECGVFSGVTSRALASFLDRRASAKRLHMFDTFAGLPDTIAAEEKVLAVGDDLYAGQFSASLESVLAQMRGCERFAIHAGPFVQTFAAFATPLCFIHADADLYESTAQIIRLADRCLVAGGTIVFDDFANAKFPGVTLAIERFLDLDRYRAEPAPDTIQYFATKR